MPFRRLKVRQFYVRLLCALLAGLLPMLLGLVIVIWQTATGVKQDAVARLEHARVMFDRTLDNAQLAASALTGSLGRPCLEVVQGLRDQVATVPDVRSVNLARGIGSTALPSMARSMAASNWMTMSGAGST